MEKPFVEGESNDPRVLIAAVADMIPSGGSVLDYERMISINADLVIVAAKSGDTDDRHSMALLCVERDMEGFRRGRNLEKMGLVAQDTAELFFDNVKVPKENVLSDPTKGFQYLISLQKKILLKVLKKNIQWDL